MTNNNNNNYDEQTQLEAERALATLLGLHTRVEHSTFVSYNMNKWLIDDNYTLYKVEHLYSKLQKPVKIIIGILTLHYVDRLPNVMLQVNNKLEVITSRAETLDLQAVELKHITLSIKDSVLLKKIKGIKDKQISTLIIADCGSLTELEDTNIYCTLTVRNCKSLHTIGTITATGPLDIGIYDSYNVEYLHITGTNDASNTSSATKGSTVYISQTEIHTVKIDLPEVQKITSIRNNKLKTILCDNVIGLYITQCAASKFKELPKNITSLNLLDLPYLEDLTGLQDSTVSSLSISNCTNLRNMKGCPGGINRLNIKVPSTMESLEGCIPIINGDFSLTMDEANPLNADVFSFYGGPHTVTGDFYIPRLGLKSLRFGPLHVGGSYDCSNNKLKSLVCSAYYIGGSFNCSGNLLLTLECGPPEVIGNYDCSNNYLVSIIGAPPGVRSFFCNENEIVSLLQGPAHIINDYNCCKNKIVNCLGLPTSSVIRLNISKNDITTLKGCTKVVKSLLASNNKITSIKHGPEEATEYICDTNPIKSLVGCPSALEVLDCSNTLIQNLVGIAKRINVLNCNFCPELVSMVGANEAVIDTINCYKCSITSLAGLKKVKMRNLNCANNKIKNLKGLTCEIEQLDCSKNEIDTLKYFPPNVLNRFVCARNKLTNLKGMAQDIEATYVDVSHNKLISLKGSAYVYYGSFLCNNNELPNLENGPHRVDNVYNCRHNKITTLSKSVIVTVNELDCSYNNLSSLAGCPTDLHILRCDHNKITVIDAKFRNIAYRIDCSDNRLSDVSMLHNVNNNIKYNNNFLVIKTIEEQE